MLIKSDFICAEIYEITNSLIIVDVNKKDLTRAISSWLEKNHLSSNVIKLAIISQNGRAWQTHIQGYRRNKVYL